MADKLTIHEFAAKIKERDDRLNDVSDEELVRKVLERRPEMISFLKTSEPRPEMGSLYEKTGRRIKSNLDPRGLIDYVGKLGEAINRPPYPHGGGLQAIGKELQSTYSKPQNILGDLITWDIMQAAGGGKTTAELVKSGIEHPIATSLQKLAGAGKEPVLLERINRQNRMLNLARRYEQAKIDISNQNWKALQDHAREVEEAQAKYQAELREYQQTETEKKTAQAEKVRQARQEWVEKAAQSRAAQREASAVDSRRETMTRSQEEYGDRLRKNLKDTYQTVTDRLKSRWDKLNKTSINRAGKLSILRDEVGNAKAIEKGMATAEKKILHGSPASVRQFRDLAGWLEQGEEGILRDPTFDELRTHYSNIGDAIYGRSVAPNIRRALQYLRNDVIGAQLQGMADKAGAGESYTALLKDHSQYEADWKDMHSVTRAGGSPLAIALQAPNTATLIPQITGPTGDIILEKLGRYREAGASPDTASAIRKLTTDMKNLPKIRVPAMPGQFELPAEAKLGQPPELKLPEPPELKRAKPPLTPPEVDPAEIRRKKIAQSTGREKRWYDFLPPKVLLDPLMSTRFIREYLANYPRREFPVPPKTPQPDPLGILGPPPGQTKP